MDQCLSLDCSLAEIYRVLRRGGRLLLWIDTLSGAPRFEPEDSSFSPIDHFHLFHFDVSWFEPMLDRLFEITERIELRRREFNRVMYCLVKKSAASEPNSASVIGVPI